MLINQLEKINKHNNRKEKMRSTVNDRYFKNPFQDYKEGDEVIFSGNETRILELMRKYVDTIIEKTHPLKTSGKNREDDLYVGDARIAFMLIKVHENFKNFFTIPALEYAKLYIKIAKENPEKSFGFLSGNAGVYAVSTVINNLGVNKKAVEANIKDYLKVILSIFH